jgi:hypothetical protein
MESLIPRSQVWCSRVNEHFFKHEQTTLLVQTCITIFSHYKLYRQNLANIESVWSKKMRRSSKILQFCQARINLICKSTLHCLFPLVCIIVFGHDTLHRKNLADIGLEWSKKIRRSLKILDTIVLPS